MPIKSSWLGSATRPYKASSCQLTTGKSVLVLGLIAACFAVLWPKIFYPMIEVALRSPKPPLEDSLAMVHPRVRQHIMRGMRSPKPGSTNQPFIGSLPRSTLDTAKSKETGGILNLLTSFYTQSLFFVFLYVFFKFIFKDEDIVYEDERDERDGEPMKDELADGEEPLIKDFQMDPDYRKFIFSEEYNENGVNIKRKVNNLRMKRRLRRERKAIVKCSSLITSKISDDEEDDLKTKGDLKKDEQICEFKKRLKIQEDAMERILRQTGSLIEILETMKFLMDDISNFKEHKEQVEVHQSDDGINTKLDKSGDEENGTSGDSVYSSENLYRSTTDYDSDSSVSSKLSKSELEE